jgi:tetratricopeptide (TPR) repeat protein
MGLGDYEGAENDLSEALKISRNIGNQEDVAANIGNLAELALRKKNWSTANNLALKALELSETNKNVDSIAINCLRIAKSLFHQKLLPDSLAFARRSLEIFARLHSKHLNEAQELISKIEINIKESNDI